MSYFDNNNLLGPTINEEHSENCMLFTLQWLLLKEETGNLDDAYEDIRVPYRCNLSRCKCDAGYLAFPGSGLHMAPGDVLASHDNLTAISCGSYHYEELEYMGVWKHILENKFRRANLTTAGTIELIPIHPRDIIFYGLLNGNKLCRLFYPLFALITVLSFFGTDTSGKLLGFVRMKTLNLDYLYNICTFMLRFSRLKNWKGVFAEYFKEYNHPNNILARQIWKD